mmetsp:Transcript_28659/g.85994  ORF Transcript_28659/g.85994 Transcript_28659/m.85994 type:complete len:202 (+) Transcript_28659:1063-1668(+)
MDSQEMRGQHVQTLTSVRRVLTTATLLASAPTLLALFNVHVVRLTAFSETALRARRVLIIQHDARATPDFLVMQRCCVQTLTNVRLKRTTVTETLVARTRMDPLRVRVIRTSEATALTAHGVARMQQTVYATQDSLAMAWSVRMWTSVFFRRTTAIVTQTASTRMEVLLVRVPQGAQAMASQRVTTLMNVFLASTTVFLVC